MTRIAHKNYFWPVQYATGYRPGQVKPPSADGASLMQNFLYFQVN